jgi:hypothetical protein
VHRREHINEVQSETTKVKAASIHIEVWTTGPLLTDRGSNLLLPLPQLVLSAAS